MVLAVVPTNSASVEWLQRQVFAMLSVSTIERLQRRRFEGSARNCTGSSPALFETFYQYHLLFSPPSHRPLALDIVSCSQRERAAHYMLSKCELHVQVVLCDVSRSVMIELFDATVKP